MASEDSFYIINTIAYIKTRLCRHLAKRKAALDINHYFNHEYNHYNNNDCAAD